MNLINNLRDGHCFEPSRTRRITGGKITKFKLVYPVLTVAYNGACSPNVFIRMAWICFGALPFRKKKNFMTARVSMLLKSRASPDILSFSLCNKKGLAIRHMNRPLFPTTLSIPSYDIGKLVGLRTYEPHRIKFLNLSTLIYWLNYDRITIKLEITMSLFKIYAFVSM